MGKDSVKPSGSSSKETKKRSKKDSNQPRRSEMSQPLENYVNQGQTYEQIATGGSSGRDETQAAQYLQSWEQTWQAASGRSN
ncbi:hypothetical protein GGR52DRAFT_573813 [Hypoxylon sp. FL1284]|nr:hypothetical protein GGR52DRAFT_573813 [Hypoxylon sp. FL1284]